MKDLFQNVTEMTPKQFLACHTLTCALLALIGCGCAPAKAAPMGEPATTVQGSVTTLEMSKVGHDLANTIAIGVSSIGVQPYASTDVDIEAKLAPTSLPMTNEEMALAELAAVVGDLATTSVAELKSRDQGKEEKKQIRRRAEEDRQQVIARKLANVVEAMEGVTISDSDFIAATTFKTSFPHQINNTATTTTISQTTATSLVPLTATESPAVLAELVRAAAVANEILAAALNVATISPLPPPSSNKDFQNSTPDDGNLVTNTTDDMMAQTEPAVESTTHVDAVTTEKVNETTEIEAMIFKGVKKEHKDQGLSEENATEHAVKPTTTESLETLIAVESEARIPKNILIPEEEALQESTTTIPEITTIEYNSSYKLPMVSESILTTNEAITVTAPSTEETLPTETTTNQQVTCTTVASLLGITTTGAQEEVMATTESPDLKKIILQTDNIAPPEQSEKLVNTVQQTTTSSNPIDSSNSITETSYEQQTERPAVETTTVFAEEFSTSTENNKETAQNSPEVIDATTSFIEQKITGTRISLAENTATQNAEPMHEIERLPTESSRSSTDAPLLSITTTLASEVQHSEASTNQANFELFPNAELIEFSPQITTEGVIITTLRSSSDTKTSANKASAIQLPEMDGTASTEEVLNATVTNIVKTVESEDVVDPEVKIVTTVALIEEQPLYATKVKQQQQLVANESYSATTTTNTIVTTEESTIEDADVKSSAAVITTSKTTVDIIVTTPSTSEVEVKTLISTNTPEPDTTSTTTTTLSPMSLIVAEHEARSLDKTPPRVNRIVNEDGVEVLTGYSIVHHMHAATLAALATEGA